MRATVPAMNTRRAPHRSAAMPMRGMLAVARMAASVSALSAVAREKPT